MNKTTNKDQLINQEIIAGLFEYDKETGTLTHKRRDGARSKAFNTAYAGKPAGTIQNSGYWQVSVRCLDGVLRLFLAHRVIFLLVYGYIPDEIDHINRNRQDNRLINLREASHAQNQANKQITKPPKSNLRGVWEVKDRGVWRAQATEDGKTKTLGYFRAKEEAAHAYDLFAISKFGEFAVLNNIYRHAP